MRDHGPVIDGLLDARDTALLREALADYTVDTVDELLGPVGRSALHRADLAGVARQLHGADPLTTLVRLFVLGEPVPEAAARVALDPLPADRACWAGLLTVSAGEARAELDVRPYGQSPNDGAPPWWVVSDFAAEIRGGPLPREHVLGVGAASLTLAQATPRDPVPAALDVGTGCGVQALHLGSHAGAVVATDVSARALRLAATTAALSGQRWELRAGSLLEPVAGERFGLVVANPPFVVSPGGAGYDYRDSGLPGDAVCARLVRSLPGVLAAGGTAQLLANWIIPADGSWQERVQGWLAGTGCDAWVWQREIAEPGEYAALWLRDAGESPGSARWRSEYDRWLDWFAAGGVAAVGMGLITMWRTDAEPVVVLEDVPQPYEQPIGPHVAAWHDRQRWLAEHDDAELLGAALAAAPALVRDLSEVLASGGWHPAAMRLRQSHGMRWEVEIDDAVSALVAGCDGTAPLLAPIGVLAAAVGVAVSEVAQALLPVVRDLVGRGFLLPEGAP